MTDHTTSDANAALNDAQRVERQTRAASRWWARYMLLSGILAFALIVAVEVFFPTGAARYGALGAWTLGVVLVGWWADSHGVHPQGARNRYMTAMGVWFLSYALLIGPLVRWKAGTSLAWWSLASAVMASPFLVAAWWKRERP
ncbi:MAG: hypothetical protein ACRDOO_25805 [Actinomadura sp.]